MRIVCPACAAAYDVPDGRLLPGRIVRCARCETDWAPVAEVAAPVAEVEAAEPEPQVAEEVAPTVEPEPEIAAPVVVADPRAAVARTKHLLALRVAWGLSVAALLAALWFGYSAREAVMHAWPASVRAYAALGLVGKD